MVSETRSRVVPGTSVTIARAVPTSALNRLDLPTLGSPTIATWRPSRTTRPRARGGEQCLSPHENAVDGRRDRTRLDEVITLVGKVDRRLEPRDQVEQRRVDGANLRVSVPFN